MRQMGIRARLALVVALSTALATALFASLSFQTVVEEVTDFSLSATSVSLDEAEQSIDAAMDDLRAALTRASDSEPPEEPEEPDDPEEPEEPEEPEDSDDVAPNLDDLDRRREDIFRAVEAVFDDLRDRSITVSVFDDDAVPMDQIEMARRFAGARSVTIEGRGTCRVVVGDINCTINSNGNNNIDNNNLLDLMEAETEVFVSDVPEVSVGEQLLVETSDGTSENIVIVMSKDIRSELNREVTTGAIARAALAVAVLLGGITWLAAGRALRPVRAMTEHVARIGNNNLDERVPVPHASDDVRSLANTMNEMLGRLQQAQDRQRQFVSDASHELRSPITATKATLEVATANPQATNWDETASILQEENVRLASLVDDLLLLARLDEQQVLSGARPVDLDEVCLAEATRYPGVDIDVRVDAPARVNGHPSMLTRAVRNLTDNATAHAQSTVSISVDVDAKRQPIPMAVVRIDDDGPGVPPEMRDQIFERFARLDEARHRSDGGGAGLGLAIVKSIAEAHGGTVQVEDSDLGGARFVLMIPMPPAID